MELGLRAPANRRGDARWRDDPTDEAQTNHRFAVLNRDGYSFARSPHVAFAESLWDADRERSLEELRRALAVAESLQLPDQHPLKIVPLARLGERARLTGDFPTAVSLLTRVVDVRSSSNGDTNDGTATPAWALFDAALRAGDMTAVASARSHLEWMMNLDESALTDAQRRIRADVTARVTDPT